MFSFFKKKKIIPHIRLTGVIGSVGKFKQGIDFNGQEEIIKKAFAIKKSPAIAISINSPGGSPVQSHLIYSFIRRLAKKEKKKVIVFAEDVAASGGYLIACAGDEIYANSSSIIGSIGVIYSSFGFKDFINVVENSRGSKLKKDLGIELFSGEFWSGSKSKELGLIDGIGDANHILKEIYGEDVIIKKFEKSKGWLAKRLSSENYIDSLSNVIEEKSIWQRYGF